MALYATLFLIFAILSYLFPDLLFWIALTIFLDPGGYVDAYFLRSYIGGLQITDLTFFLLLLPLLSPKVAISEFFKNVRNRWITYHGLAFTLIYHVLVYGLIQTNASVTSLLDLLQYERLTLVGFIAIIPAYIFFKRGYRTLIAFAIITSAIVGVFFLVDIVVQTDILPKQVFFRSLTDAQRIIIKSDGYGNFFIYAAFIAVIFNVKFRYRNLVLLTGLIFTVATLMALTRREIIGLVFILIVSVIVKWRVYRSRFDLKTGLRLVFGFLFFLLMALIFVPSLVIDSVEVVTKSLGLLNRDVSGLSDARLERDIPEHLRRFKQSPLFGYGYDSTWYSNLVEEGGVSANDVPLTAAMGMFGIVGLLFFSIFYLIVFRDLRRLFELIRRYFDKLNSPEEHLIQSETKTLLFIGLILFVFHVERFGLKFMNLFNDIIVGEARVENMVYFGFLIAVVDELRSRLNLPKYSLRSGE